MEKAATYILGVVGDVLGEKRAEELRGEVYKLMPGCHFFDGDPTFAEESFTKALQTESSGKVRKDLKNRLEQVQWQKVRRH